MKLQENDTSEITDVLKSLHGGSSVEQFWKMTMTPADSLL